MKIAFATLYNPRDVQRGSGSYYFMSHELENQGHQVAFIGPVNWVPSLMTKVLKWVSRKLGKRFRSHQDLFVARQIGQIVSSKLCSVDCDVLLTNDYSIAAFTHSAAPIILYTDALFPRHYSDNIHPWLDNLSFISVRFCQYVTRRGLRRAHLCCFPAKSTVELVRDYRIAEHKIRLIPFGANFTISCTAKETQRTFGLVLKKGYIELLFVGNDWSLKGGEIAIQVTQLLRDWGVNATLHIVGTKPPELFESKNIVVHGYLNRAKRGEEQKLQQLYQSCDVLILPTLAEGFGIVFAEAAAYSMPSLSFQTTGVTTAVKDGVSGVLLPLDSYDPVYAFANIIQSWFVHPERYDSLARGARQHFEELVNWQVAVTRLIAEIETVVK